MAPRSTRQKIKDHCTRMIQDLNRFQGHMYDMHAMSQGRSEAINRSIPPLLEASNLLIQMCRALYAEL